MFIKIHTYILFLFLVCKISLLEAQQGDYYLSNFETPQDIASNENYFILQDHYDRMCIANRKGVLTFDGTNWSLTHTPSSPLTLTLNKENKRLYVGCLHNFGYIQRLGDGTNEFISIGFHGDTAIPPITNIISYDNEMYFIGGNNLYIVSEDEKVETYRCDTIKEFSDVFVFNDRLWFSSEEGILFEYANNKLEFRQKLPNNDPIYCHTSFDDKLLIANASDSLFVFDGEVFTPFVIQDDTSYLKESHIFAIESFSDSLLIIATHLNGCIVVNKETGKTHTFINYFTGLPDNNVYAISKDNFGGIWMSHAYGFTRLDNQLPYKTFSNFTGLEGHINAITYFKEKLYVGTSQGVYYLDQVEDYSIVENVIKLKELVPIMSTRDDMIHQEKKSSIREKRGFLGLGKKEVDRKKTKRKKRKDKKSVIAKNSFQVGTKTNYRYVKKTEKVLHSVQYSFQKNQGIKSGCNQLIVQKNQLVAITNQGVFDIENGNAVLIYDKAAKFATTSSDGKGIYLLNYNGDLHYFNYVKDHWNHALIEYDMTFLPSYIYQDKRNNLWLCSEENVLQVVIKNRKVVSEKVFSIKNPYYDDIWMVELDNQLKLITQSEILDFDEESNAFVVDTSYNEILSNPHRFIHSQKDITWLHEKNNWTFLSDNVYENKNHILLSLVPDIKEIFVDNERHLYWVINNNDQLYAFYPEREINFYHGKDIYLSKVKNKKGNYLPIRDLALNHEQNYIEFVYYNPNYLNHHKVSYQYKIKGLGLDQSWSNWSVNSTVKLDALVPGKYTVLMRMKNVFNEVTQGEPISFEVKAPYWETTWFLVLEIVFFALLLLLSFKMSKSTNTRNAVLRKALIFLTLIITAEYLETIGQIYLDIGNSPVTSFIIQVVLAMAVFPVERFLFKKLSRNEEAVS